MRILDRTLAGEVAVDDFATGNELRLTLRCDPSALSAMARDLDALIERSSGG